MWNNGDAGIYIQDSEHNQVINNIAHQESDGGVVINGAHGTVIRQRPALQPQRHRDLRLERHPGHRKRRLRLAGGRLRDRQRPQHRRQRQHREPHRRRRHRRRGCGFDTLGLPIGTAVIQGNTTNENLADGIEVADGAGHLVADNTAFNNQGHGIVAEGNVDGGGNVASGNGAVRPDAGNPPEPPDPTFPQCLGVVCANPNAPPWSVTDTVAPNSLITAGPVGAAPVPLPPNTLLKTANTSATFEFTGTDNVFPESALVFECRLDPPPDIIEPVDPPDPEPGPPDPGPGDTSDQDPYLGEGWGHCINPVHFHNLEAGVHRFEVMVRDQADPEPNIDLTPVVYYWDIDLSAPGDFDGLDSQAPDTFIVRSPDAATISTSATFRFNGSDNMTPGVNLTYECRRYYDANESISEIPAGVPWTPARRRSSTRPTRTTPVSPRATTGSRRARSTTAATWTAAPRSTTGRSSRRPRTPRRRRPRSARDRTRSPFSPPRRSRSPRTRRGRRTSARTTSRSSVLARSSSARHR